MHRPLVDPLAGVRGTSAEREERQRAAAVRVRAAFRGNITAGADVLSLAAQLGGEGGDALADRLAEDPLDPMVFMAGAARGVAGGGACTLPIRLAPAY